MAGTTREIGKEYPPEGESAAIDQLRAPAPEGPPGAAGALSSR